MKPNGLKSGQRIYTKISFIRWPFFIRWATRWQLPGIFIIATWGCQPNIHTVQESRVLMDTLVSINVYIQNPAEEPAGRQAIAIAFAEMARLDSLFSSYRQDSEVAMINHCGAQGGELSVSADADTVLRVAQWAAKISNGAFDVTVAPILQLWRFGTDSAGVPAPEKIRQRLPAVNYQNLTITPAEAGIAGARIDFHRPGMAIDLGGVAKGYAVERGIEALLQAGIRDAMITAGGDLRAVASPLTAGRRYIWIRHPRPANLNRVTDESALERQEFFGRFKLEGSAAISTSGDYERFFEKDGKRYHHLIDPHTGYPAAGAISATVMAKNSAQADALSTALFVLGPRQGIALADSLPEVEAVIIHEDGGELKWQATSALKKNLEIFPSTEFPRN
jgi:thiamine biosynthesis lipoprotein